MTSTKFLFSHLWPTGTPARKSCNASCRTWLCGLPMLALPNTMRTDLPQQPPCPSLLQSIAQRARPCQAELSHARLQPWLYRNLTHFSPGKRPWALVPVLNPLYPLRFRVEGFSTSKIRKLKQVPPPYPLGFRVEGLKPQNPKTQASTRLPCRV